MSEKVIKLNVQEKADLCVYAIMAGMAMLCFALSFSEIVGHVLPFEFRLSLILMAGPPYWFGVNRLRAAATGRMPFTDDKRSRLDKWHDGGSASL